MNPGEKICSRCRCVYRPGVDRCSDCGVDLVHPDEVTAPTELAEAPELVAIRITSVMWARAFSEVMSEAGIPHRIDQPPTDDATRGLRRRSHDQAVAIYVRPEDAEAARRADADFVKTQIPDLPTEVASGEEESESCPACGDPLDPDRSECPGCGLFVGAVDGE